MPPRSFRAAFSHSSASLETSLRSALSNATPAVFTRWLWQPTQYVLINSPDGAEAEAVVWAGSGLPDTDVHTATTRATVAITNRPRT